MTDLKNPIEPNDQTAVDWNSYDLGAAAKPRKPFPPEGVYLLKVPTLDLTAFDEGPEGQLKAKIGPLFIFGGEYDGFEIRYCTISNKRYSNRNASQMGDFLLTAKSPFRPQTKEQWKQAVIATSGSFIEALCEWDAYDKLGKEGLKSLASGMANFPLDPDGPGGHQRFIEVADPNGKPSVKDPSKLVRRVWANLRVKYFRVPRPKDAGTTGEALGASSAALL